MPQVTGATGSLRAGGYNLIGHPVAATVTPAPGDQVGVSTAPIDPESTKQWINSPATVL